MKEFIYIIEDIFRKILDPNYCEECTYNRRNEEWYKKIRKTGNSYTTREKTIVECPTCKTVRVMNERYRMATTFGKIRDKSTLLDIYVNEEYRKHNALMLHRAEFDRDSDEFRNETRWKKRKSGRGIRGEAEDKFHFWMLKDDTISVKNINKNA